MAAAASAAAALESERAAATAERTALQKAYTLMTLRPWESAPVSQSQITREYELMDERPMSDLLEGLPGVRAEDDAMLTGLLESLRSIPPVPPGAPEKGTTTTSRPAPGSVHEFVDGYLHVLFPTLGVDDLRLAYVVGKHDSAEPAHKPFIPNITVLHRRDAAVTCLTSLLYVEVVTVGTLQHGVVLAQRYTAARSRNCLMARPLVRTAASHSFAVATDGVDMVIQRLDITATLGSIALLSTRSPSFPILSAEAVAVWARLLRATPSQLGSTDAGPLEVMTMESHGISLALGDRLAQGGYCDVYRATIAGGEAAVKVRRDPPDPDLDMVEESHVMETVHLEAAEQGVQAHVPEVVSCSFGALVMRPLGAATVSHLRAYMVGGAEPVPYARMVARGALRALGASHAAGIMHGDVRTSNLVVVPAMGDGASRALPAPADSLSAVLADWNAAVRFGKSVFGMLGVPAFAPDAVLQGECVSCAALDLESVAYVYLAIVACRSGDAAVPPWYVDSPAKALVARQEWIAAAEAERMAALVPGLDFLRDVKAAARKVRADLSPLYTRFDD